MQIETLRSLRERAAAATGADRELDARLQFFFDPKKGISYGYGDDFCWVTQAGVSTWGDAEWAEAAESLSLSIPRYTSSLDAAVALGERMLPGWKWAVRTCSGGPTGSVHHPSETPNVWNLTKAGRGATPALALICALLDALITQAEQKTSPSD